MVHSKFLVGAATAFIASHATAASGEMGTGIPQFGAYSSVTGTRLAVWSLANPSRPMAAGCSSLILSPETMGLEAYKIAVALLTAAKLSDRRVRFYAHGEHDGGCGVDYVEID